MSKKLLLAEKKKEDTKPKEQNSTMSAEDIKKINHTAPTKRPDMKIEIVNGAPVISYVGKDPLKKGRLFKDRDLDAEVQRLFGYSSWNEYKKDNKNDLVGPQATVHPIHVALALDEFVRNFRPADYVLVGVPISGQPTEANLKALGLSGLRKGFFGDEKGSQSVSQMGILNSAMFAPAGGLSNVKAITMAKENLGVDEMLDQLKRLKYAVIHPEGGYWSDTRPLGQTRNMSKAIQTRMFSENTEAVMLSEGLGGASKEFLKFLAQGILRIGGRGKELSKAAIRALTGGLDDVGLNILERSKNVLIPGSPKSLKVVNDIIRNTDEQKLMKAITARVKEVLSRPGELHKKDTLRQELEMLLRLKVDRQRGFAKLNLRKKLLDHFDAVADASVAARTTAAGTAAAGTVATGAAAAGTVAAGAAAAGTVAAAGAGASSLGRVATGVFIGRNADRIFKAIMKAKGRLAIGGLTGWKAYTYLQKNTDLDPDECLIAAAIFAGAGAFIVPAALKITIGIALTSLKYLGGIGLTGYVVGQYLNKEVTDAVVGKLWEDIKKRAQKLIDNWPALASYGIDSVVSFFESEDIPPMPPAVANALGITDVPTEKPDEKPEVAQTTQKVEGVKQLKMLLLPKRWRDGEYLTSAEKILAQRVGANQATGLMVMNDGERSYEGYLKFSSALAAKLAADAATKANQQLADAPDQQAAKINFGKVLIFGHSQAGRYASQLGSKIKSQGGKVVKKIYSGLADEDANNKEGLKTKIKTITGEFTHAYLFLNGNTAADGNLYEKAKRSIIEHTTGNLKVPKQNIVVILPPVNLSDPNDYNLDHVKKYYKQKKDETSEKYNARLNAVLAGIRRNASYSSRRGEGINKRARTYFEGLGVKVLNPITSTNISDFPDGYHISRLSALAGTAADQMIGSSHRVAVRSKSDTAQNVSSSRALESTARKAGLDPQQALNTVNIIIDEAAKAGVNQRLALTIARIESKFNHLANMNKKAGAKGLFQFMRKYRDEWDRKYGLKWEDVYNTRENAKAFMRLVKNNISALRRKGIIKKSTVSNVDAAEAHLIYMSWNQGLRGTTIITNAAKKGTSIPAGIKNNMRGNAGSQDQNISDQEMAQQFINTWKRKTAYNWRQAGEILANSNSKNVSDSNTQTSNIAAAALGFSAADSGTSKATQSVGNAVERTKSDPQYAYTFGGLAPGAPIYSTLNENQITGHGASMNKPILALIHMMMYKQAPQKLTDQELKAMLAYTGGESNTISKLVSGVDRKYSTRDAKRKKTIGTVNDADVARFLRKLGLDSSMRVRWNNNKQTPKQFFDFMRLIHNKQKISSLGIENEISKILSYMRRDKSLGVSIGGDRESQRWPVLLKAIQDKGLQVSKIYGKGGLVPSGFHYALVIDDKYLLTMYSKRPVRGKELKKHINWFSNKVAEILATVVPRTKAKTNENLLAYKPLIARAIK